MLFIVLIARRLKIKKLNKRQYNKTIQYNARQEMKIKLKCDATKKIQSTEETDMGKIKPIDI